MSRCIVRVTDRDVKQLGVLLFVIRRPSPHTGPTKDKEKILLESDMRVCAASSILHVLMRAGDGMNDDSSKNTELEDDVSLLPTSFPTSIIVQLTDKDVKLCCVFLLVFRPSL